MKKIIITFICMLILPVYALSASENSDSIERIENSLFGYDYKNESDSARIERLEQHLYGSKKSGNINKRIEDIKNDIGFSQSQSQNEKQMEFARQTQSKDNTQIYDNQNAQQQEQLRKKQDILALKEDSSVEYPMVDKMEQQVFNTTYKNENIYNRLNRLEEKVFNKTSSEDLNLRVDNLASVVIPQKNKNRSDSSRMAYSNPNMNSYYSNDSIESVNAQSMPFQLAALEEDILKSSYINDNNANRLSRLEQKLFKRSFPNDSDIIRLQRIMAAYDAKKNSYKYENNRRMQNMATVSQIGSILLMILAILL